MKVGNPLVWAFFSICVLLTVIAALS